MASTASSSLLHTAWTRIQQAYRPSTSSTHLLHFRTFLAYLLFMDLPIVISVHNILTFVEYLYQNHISPKVISTYLSSIQAKARLYNWDFSAIAHPSISRYIRSIPINSSFNPTTRGIFDLQTLYNILVSCEILSDPVLYRANFLTAFFGFLHMSNLAKSSTLSFKLLV